MLRSPETLAIVLARGGSTRLPNKNLLEIGSKTLVLRAIEGAARNKIRVILSSNDEKILRSIEDSGVLKHKRSEENSTATSTSEESVLEILDSFHIHDESEILLLQPTSPFRTISTVKRFLDQWNESKKLETFDSAFSAVAEYSELWRLSPTGNLNVRASLDLGDVSHRSQDKTPLFRENGAIYLTKAERIRSGYRFINGKSFIFRCSQIESIDIDTEEDLRLAKSIYSLLGNDES